MAAVGLKVLILSLISLVTSNPEPIKYPTITNLSCSIITDEQLSSKYLEINCTVANSFKSGPHTLVVQKDDDNLYLNTSPSVAADKRMSHIITCTGAECVSTFTVKNFTSHDIGKYTCQIQRVPSTQHKDISVDSDCNQTSHLVKNQESQLSTGAIVGVVVGSLFGLALIVFLLLCFLRVKKYGPWSWCSGSSGVQNGKKEENIHQLEPLDSEQSNRRSRAMVHNDSQLGFIGNFETV